MTFGTGIVHMEDLPVDKIVESFRHLTNFSITEKLDGSQLFVGMDELGLYTSREGKGDSKRYRSSDDYPMQFSTNYMRGAHLTMEALIDKKLIHDCFSVGDCIEVEVLYGDLPNVVEYRGSGGNKVVYLRTISGNPDIDTIMDRDNGYVIIHLMRALTATGKGIYCAPDKERWEFTIARPIPIENMGKGARESILGLVGNLEHYLTRHTGLGNLLVKDIITLPLNRKPDGFSDSFHTLRPRLKEAKEECNRVITESIIKPIKRILLESLVHTTRSQFGLSRHDGGWIEGLVFRNIFTDEQFKVIDKSLFLAVKNFAWKERELLMKKPSSVDKCDSFLGNTQITLGAMIGYPILGTMQARKALNAGRIDVSWVNMTKTKEDWLKRLRIEESNLDRKLAIYSSNRRNMAITVPNGAFVTELSYVGEIHERTLQTFAVVRKKLLEMDIKVRQAKVPMDFVEILVPRRENETR